MLKYFSNNSGQDLSIYLYTVYREREKSIRSNIRISSPAEKGQKHFHIINKSLGTRPDQVFPFFHIRQLRQMRRLLAVKDGFFSMQHPLSWSHFGSSCSVVYDICLDMLQEICFWLCHISDGPGLSPGLIQ